MSPQTGIWTDFAAESMLTTKTDLLFLSEQAKNVGSNHRINRRTGRTFCFRRNTCYRTLRQNYHLDLQLPRQGDQVQPEIESSKSIRVEVDTIDIRDL
jgi:hypothetical protein